MTAPNKLSTQQRTELNQRIWSAVVRAIAGTFKRHRENTVKRFFKEPFWSGVAALLFLFSLYLFGFPLTNYGMFLLALVSIWVALIIQAVIVICDRAVTAARAAKKNFIEEISP
jgi:hypothetical protein